VAEPFVRKLLFGDIERDHAPLLAFFARYPIVVFLHRCQFFRRKTPVNTFSVNDS
jgi:hypothetical protein